MCVCVCVFMAVHIFIWVCLHIDKHAPKLYR